MIRCIGFLMVAGVVGLPARAQPGADYSTEALCAVIKAWGEGFSRSRFKLSGSYRVTPLQGPEYAVVGLEEGIFQRSAGRTVTHHSMLMYLVGRAERRQCAAVAEAVLPLAAAGYSSNLYGHQIVMVRDAAHFALLRMAEPEVWAYIRKAAAGWGVGSAEPGIPQRVAAIRLLGMKSAPPHRLLLEKGLLSSNDMIRLASTEALGSMHQHESLAVIARAVGSERHPVVAQALVASMDRILRENRAQVTDSERDSVIAIAMSALGRAGWRSDLMTVRLLRSHPAKVAVPDLIDLLDGPSSEDRLLKIVNDQASPILRHEAWRSLRRITGAILPDDAGRWRDFWRQEGSRLEVAQPQELRKPVGATEAKGSFFGIPVLGREVVFVIDASTSMADEVFHTVTASGRKKPRKKGATRLDIAKSQVLHAVAGIRKGTRYHLVSFADEVQVWNHKPVPARATTYKTLTEVMGRIKADGGTNTLAALYYVLNHTEHRYGQEIKSMIDEVFILSDGRPSVGEVHEPERILEIVRDLNRYQNIRINTVYTGHGNGHAFMKRLAESNHGVFVWKR